MTDYRDVIGGAPLTEDKPLGGEAANDYRDAIDAAVPAPNPALKTSLNAALESKPDQYAEAKALGAQINVPASVAERNIDIVRKKVGAQFYDSLAQEYPVLAKKLENVDFAKLAHDDHERLTSIEKLFREQGFKAASEALRNKQDAARNSERGMQAESELGREYREYQAGRAEETAPMRGFRKGAAAFSSGSFGVARALVDLARDTLPETLGTAGEGFLTFASERERENTLAQQAVGTPAGAFRRNLEGALTSITAQLPALFTGGANSAVAAMVTQSFGGEYARGIEAGLGGADAAKRASIFAAAEGVGERLGLGFLFKGFKAAAEGVPTDQVAGFFAKALLADVPGEAGTYSTQFLTDKLAPFGLDKGATGEQFIAGLVDTFAQTVLQGGVMTTAGLATSAVAQRFARDDKRAAEALEMQQMLQQIQQLTTASQLAARDPQSFQAFVDEAAKEGPVNEVFVDGNVFAQSMETAGITPEQLQQAAPEAAAQLAEAVATGSTVRISIGEFAARIAPTELGNALMPHLKADPNGMSQDEAKVFMQSAAADLKAQAEKILADQPEQDAFAQSAMKVEQTFRDQLNLTNRFTPDVNNAYATLIGAFYTTMAKRLNTTPEALYSKYQLRVQSTGLAGENVMDQQPGEADAQIDTPEFQEWFGESAVVDESGEPMVVYHGTQSPPEAFSAVRDGVVSSILGSATVPRYGIFVTPHARLAESFATQGERPSNATVMPLYASILNPLDMTQGYTDAIFNAVEAWGDKNIEGYLAGHKFARYLGNNWNHWSLFDKDGGGDPELLIRMLKDLGYDGVKFWESDPSENRDDPVDGETYVAFDPTQIKSAIGNSGAFDGDDPNILNQPLSTRVPTAVRATEDALGEEILIIDHAAMKASPAAYKKNLALIAKYPIIKLTGKAEEKAEQFINHVIGNLLWLHDQVPATVRARSKKWYDGANAIAKRWAEEFGLEPAQVAGVLAVLSPGRDWFQNVSLAERVLTVVSDRGNFAWDDKMSTAAARIYADPKFKPIVDAITGRKFNELGTDLQRAAWLRAYDETYNDRGFKLVTPEGEFGGNVAKGDETDRKVAWGSLAEIAKAVAIMHDGSRENLSKRLGRAHKVRSFYNNIIDPNGTRGDVTIDTHAVAAAQLRPLAQTSTETTHSMGSGSNSSITGAQGVYGLYAEAYRRAAQQRGVLPREMQSITWEAVRGLFTPEFKRSKEAGAIHEIWKKHKAGTLSADAARAAVLEAAGRIDPPDWFGPGGGADAGAGDGSQPGELPGTGVPERDAGGGDSARARGDTRRAARLARRTATYGQSGLEQGGRSGVVGLSEALAEADDAARGEAPLAGLPVEPQLLDGRWYVPGPFFIARETALAYANEAGVPYNQPRKFRKVSPARAKRIAEAYTRMKHDPHDPEVRRAYEAMIEETLAQYEQILKTGIKVEFITGPNPYESSPRGVMRDVIDNDHIWVFPSLSGFGTSAAFDASQNPLLQGTKYTDINGVPMTANDVFRVVHDYFGHIKEGNGFRADGEENAWRMHAAMYTPLARRAMTSETRGQNSWVNYGPHGDHNRTARSEPWVDEKGVKHEGTFYADQKTGLLPDWVMTEGLEDPADDMPGNLAIGNLVIDGVVYGQGTFYSGLQRAVEGAKQGKAPAAQWLGMIKNLPGVKAEEIEWTGLEEWLGQQDGSVSKEAVLEFLRANEIKVEEVEKGAGESEAKAMREVDDLKVKLDAKGYSVLSNDEQVAVGVTRRSDNKTFVGDDTADIDGDGLMSDLPSDVQTMVDRLNEITAARDEGELRDDETQFASYTLPGAKKGSYRELLLTLPKTAPKMERTLTGFKDVDTNFRSSHFDTPNILAHVRFNERTDADGKRVLFIEEVQSDWHQKGRRQGYRTDGKWSDEESARYYTIKDKPWESRSQDENDFITALDRRKQQANNPQGGNVPDAPFKTTWPMLAMKRMLRYAVDNGYGRIAWTTGEQQADRYDLSKKIESLRVAGPNTDGVYLISAYGPRGAALIPRKQATAAELPEIVGKDLADKIIKGEGGTVHENDGGAQHYSGLDLKIGGEGMVGFYDKMLPAEMNRYTKKWGGKVASTKVQTGEDAVYGTSRSGYTNAAGDQLGRSQQGAMRKVYEKNRSEVHSLDITDAMRESVAGGQALFQKTGAKEENRGQISMANDITSAPSVITLLKHADLSTFLHETGHFFLEVMADIASQPGAPQQVVDDLNTFFKTVGVKDLAEWKSLSIEQKRPRHEVYARSFEAYLFSGKSPNVELHGLFSRFAAWLKNVYTFLKNLHVDLSPEVSGVFDRLLATDEQIREAEHVRSIKFDPEIAKLLDPEQAAAYEQDAQRATQASIDQLAARGLKDMQWLRNARGRELLKLQREAAAKRKETRKEVLEEVRRQPVYAALRFLTRGELPDGTLLPEGVHAGKLSLPALKAMYGESAVAPWRNLNAGKYGAVAADGLHPDTVAQLFGFTSGDHLVRAIIQAQPERQVVEGATDQRMLEKYGDLSTEQGLERAADQAVHNSFRGKVIATEINALHTALGQRRILAKAAKQFAETLIARKRVREIRPAQHSAAAARASREADKTKDIAEKANLKRTQLVQHYATAAAYEAQDEVAKGLRYLRRFDDAKNIDHEYLEQIRKMLARFELAKLTLKEQNRRASLAKWIEAQRDAGLDPQIDEDLADEAFRAPYDQLTLEQFRGLVSAVRNIEHLGRLKDKLLTAAEDRLFKDAVKQLVDSINANAKKTLPERRSSERGALVEPLKIFRTFLAAHRKYASLVREFDGFSDGGPAWQLLVRNMNAAGDKEAVDRADATKQLSALLAPILKEGKFAEKTYFAGSGKSFTREEIIGIALNMGNEVNRERVMTGEKLSPAQLQEILDTLTKQEWDFVQGVWDFIDGYWQRIADKQKRLTGVEPEKVEAMPVQTRFGEYKGGYYPIAYDPNLSERSHADTEAEVHRQLTQGLYTASQTRRGHTKARVDSTGRTLRYDFASVITKHVDQVVHDLAWHEYLIDANRLLRDSGVETAIRDHYGVEVLRELKQTLVDVAVGDMAAHSGAERVLTHIRHGATIAGLGWKLSTALLQPLGLTQSIVRVGAKWMARGAHHWLRGPEGFVKSLEEIQAKSDFMRLRANTMQREIAEIRNKVAGNDSKLEASYFWMIHKMQLVADIPTWWGAYEKAMASSPDEKHAIALADQAVRDAQGSGGVQDLARVQRGHPAWKLFTNFYSFFNTTFNMTAEVVGRTNFRKPSSVAAMTVDMAMLYTVPAMLGTLLKALLSGDWDDEKKLAKQLIADQVNYLLGTVVLLRELGGAMRHLAGLPGPSYSGPAGVRLFSAIDRLATQAGQGELDEGLLKALNQVGGVIFHYPAGQVEATAEGANALAEGKTNNPGALVVGAPN